MENVHPGNDTYVHYPHSETLLVDRIKSDMSKFRIVPDNSEAKLALLYQNPKLTVARCCQLFLNFCNPITR